MTSSDTLPFLFSVVGAVWYFVLWSIGLLGCYTARKRYRFRSKSPLASAPKQSTPGVSILRPLKGLDTNLYENLESTFLQDYPNFEIILSVADEYDQALPIVRELIEKYPSVDAKIVIGEEVVGTNPKVNNLIRPYRQATNDILWVLDSNILVDRGTLTRSIDVLDTVTSSGKRIALIHHVPYAVAGQGHFGSAVEAAFLNTNHAKMYVAINTVGIESCVVGKSNIYRKSDIERVNGTLKTIPEGGKQEGECGLAVFGRFLPEDNMIASALWHELGFRHDLSCDVSQNAVGRMSVSDYIQRRVRWIRVRKYMSFAATLVEPLTECIAVSAIGALSLQYLVGIPWWFLLFVHYPIWIAVDLDVYASLAGKSLPSNNLWSFLLAWGARECLAFPIWLSAIWGNTVVWRGKTYVVLPHGEVKRPSGRNDHYERLEVESLSERA